MGMIEQTDEAQTMLFMAELAKPRLRGGAEEIKDGVPYPTAYFTLPKPRLGEAADDKVKDKAEIQDKAPKEKTRPAVLSVKNGTPSCCSARYAWKIVAEAARTAFSSQVFVKNKAKCCQISESYPVARNLVESQENLIKSENPEKNGYFSMKNKGEMLANFQI